tara:strand:- start:303 stop:497 length:195 start_codon:yes stop_codon:yes gene_type:complete
MVSRLRSFLIEDLKEIDHSFQNVREAINCKIYYEQNTLLAKDIERLERFIIYWSNHAKNIGKDY